MEGNMKYIITLFILLTSSVLFAAGNTALRSKALNHLKSQGYGYGEIIVEQESNMSIMYLEKFAIEDSEHPCHVGVIVDKNSGNVVLDEDDHDLTIDMPYSDIIIKFDDRIILFCAD